MPDAAETRSSRPREAARRWRPASRVRIRSAGGPSGRAAARMPVSQHPMPPPGWRFLEQPTAASQTAAVEAKQQGPGSAGGCQESATVESAPKGFVSLRQEQALSKISKVRSASHRESTDVAAGRSWSSLVEDFPEAR